MSGESLVSIALGLGLSAACGFRIFVPPLVIGAAARLGYLTLSPGFQWMDSTPALIAFGTATVLELCAYSVPWLDNFLDFVATPAAVISGILASASVFIEMPPLVRWSVALICGGSVAGLVQGATVLLRLKSLALSGGLTNPLLSASEFAGSALISIFAIALPLLCLAFLAVGSFLVFRSAGRVFFGRGRAG